MNRGRAAVIVVVAVLVGAVGIFVLRSWVGIEEGEDLNGGGSGSSSRTSPDEVEPTPRPSPTASSERDDEDGAQLASPSGIAADIESRLDRSGQKTTVSCPQVVPDAVGTSFSCPVAYADAPDEAVADARVDIVGPGLRYVWRSVPR